MRVYLRSLAGPVRVEWPDDWPLPRPGDRIDLGPDVPGPVVCREVRWFPAGDEALPEPFVMVVIGRPFPAAF